MRNIVFFFFFFFLSVPGPHEGLPLFRYHKEDSSETANTAKPKYVGECDIGECYTMANLD